MNSPTMRDKLALERTQLANERTFLAYVRTALSLIAGAVVLLQFFPSQSAYLTIGWVLLGMGALVLIFGIARFAHVKKRLAAESKNVN